MALTGMIAGAFFGVAQECGRRGIFQSWGQPDHMPALAKVVLGLMAMGFVASSARSLFQYLNQGLVLLGAYLLARWIVQSVIDIAGYAEQK